MTSSAKRHHCTATPPRLGRNLSRTIGVRTEDYWRPNKGDWNQEVEKQLEETAFPYEIAAAYWEQLQSAREFVHQRSLPLRAVAAPELVERLDRLEAAFDTVFMRCISESYYMRLLPDIYDEVIPERLDVLVKAASNEEEYK